MPTRPGTPNRRAVLIGAAGVAGGAVLAGCSKSGSGDKVPPAGAGLGPESAVPATGGIVVATAGDPVVLARTATGQVVAHSAICTHQGCTVRAGNGEMDCPCHGSVFDPVTGAVKRGPAREPLPAIPVTVTDGAVVVAGPAGTSGSA